MIKSLNNIPKQVNCPSCLYYAFLTETEGEYVYKGSDIKCVRYNYLCHNCREEFSTTEIEEVNTNILKSEYRNYILQDLID